MRELGAKETKEKLQELPPPRFELGTSPKHKKSAAHKEGRATFLGAWHAQFGTAQGSMARTMTTLPCPPQG